ncbi:hypothetical protein [Psychrobacter frigidicola]|uniref:hypothetical protein n=1 Tax=Psychrobacter frigidicola TaxID=45611 RepID=UPI00191B5F8D|nr:hypothetical protein [Psychrobacter frigidicola]
MFNFLTLKPDAVPRDAAIINQKFPKYLRHTRPLLATMLAGTLLLSACQQQADPTTEDNSSQTRKQTAEQKLVAANKPAPQSDSAAARIAQFQPLYVTQMQGLQRRLQAEYESLEAADEDNVSLLTNPVTSTANSDAKSTAQTSTSTPNVAADTVSIDNPTTANTETNAEINISTEVGERDLEVLKRISLEPREPREPELLTEGQIIERYQQVLQALYQSEAEALSAQETDTLLNIAALVPELFEHAEIAKRVSIKSPALARLIIQHQVWQQIEAQQSLDMQQMKQTQQQEFESLMSKFNETIEGYDEQIAKYEQTLKEFSDSSK